MDKLGEATANAQGPDRESLRHACIWKAKGMLLWRLELAYERSCISRNMGSVAELKESFFAEIDNVENGEDFGRASTQSMPRNSAKARTIMSPPRGSEFSDRSV
jgi:hypothetical protein